METTNESFKECVICCQNLPITNFRPKRRMCRCCVYKREAQTQKALLREYYLKNKDKLILKQVINYHKKNDGQIKRRTKPIKHFINIT
jgi:hypothetical protein